MENLRKMFTGRLFSFLQRRDEPEQPLGVNETLQFPDGTPLEVAIARRTPQLEGNQRRSINELVDFFGLRMATAAKKLPIPPYELSRNFDVAIEEARLGQTILRATRVVKVEETTFVSEKGKLSPYPDVVRVSVRLMTAGHADQAEIHPGDRISDEMADAIILARWENPRFFQETGTIYTEFRMNVERKTASSRYASVWNLSVHPTLRRTHLILPDQREFHISFDGELL